MKAPQILQGPDQVAAEGLKIRREAGAISNLRSFEGEHTTILPELKNCQKGTFEPVHEIQKLFWPKDFF